MQRWQVYLLRCGDGSLYTGITTDLEARIQKHSDGKGAAYTRSHLPVTLVWYETAASESMARKREAEIKRWKRHQKLNLIQHKT
jgi:putative endonuclease